MSHDLGRRDKRGREQQKRSQHTLKERRHAKRGRRAPTVNGHP
jgi:hypothetical protein